MKKYLTIMSISTIAIFFLAKQAYAGGNCQFIYGGGISCGSENLLVKKQVLQPGTANNYVDNVSINDPHYQPNSPIFFKITIKNISSNTLQNITVLDTFDSSRQYVDFTDGPGNFDAVSKTLTYKLASLLPNEEKTITIAGKVTASKNFPANQHIVCATNTVEVSPANDAPTEATSEFCIDTAIKTTQATQQTTKGGITIKNQTFPVLSPTPAKKSPSTGPETLPLLALIPMGSIGLWLRKKTK